MASTGLLALIVSTQAIGWLQLAAMVLWGYCFWMSIPGVFTLLAAKSRYPAERAGDAQAYLSGGRVLGPFVGGLTIERLGAPSLGFLAAAVMIGAGLLALYVARPEPAAQSLAAGSR
jgi:DHA1 family inner membrane transport protein